MTSELFGEFANILIFDKGPTVGLWQVRRGLGCGVSIRSNEIGRIVQLVRDFCLLLRASQHSHRRAA